MQNNILKEVSSGRVFERISRWNVIDYTLVSRKNRLAPFADNYDDKNAASLNLTCFKFDTKIHPLKQFETLATPIVLEDNTVLSSCASDKNMLLEVSPDGNKVRVYKEVL